MKDIPTLKYPSLYKTAETPVKGRDRKWYRANDIEAYLVEYDPRNDFYDLLEVYMQEGFMRLREGLDLETNDEGNPIT